MKDANDALLVFMLFGRNDDRDSLWYRILNSTHPSMELSALCNEVFEVASADSEPVESRDIPLLESCYDDLYNSGPGHGLGYLGELYAARKRSQRPLKARMGRVPREIAVLFPEEPR